MVGSALISSSALLAAAVLAMLLRARKSVQEAPEPRDTPGLPPIANEQSRLVMRQAEQSAIRTALGASSADLNPYPKGTRAHILWETHYHSVLMEWTDGH